MTDRRRFTWRSGRLPSTPITGIWSVSLDAKDPQIPNLPLESSSSVVVHNATGSLVGAIEGIAGTGKRFRAHPATGALTGALGGIVGTAARLVVHAATGALVGQGSTIAGVAEIPDGSQPRSQAARLSFLASRAPFGMLVTRERKQ